MMRSFDDRSVAKNHVRMLGIGDVVEVLAPCQANPTNSDNAMYVKVEYIEKPDSNMNGGTRFRGSIIGQSGKDISMFEFFNREVALKRHTDDKGDCFVISHPAAKMIFAKSSGTRFTDSFSVRCILNFMN